MDKKTKATVGKVLGIATILTGIGAIVWKNYKKGLEELEKEHDELVDHLTDLGFSNKDAEEAIENEENGESNDISLLTFKLVTSGKSKYFLSKEITCTDEAICTSDVIHVRSSRNNGGVEIIYQIPGYDTSTKSQMYANSPRGFDYFTEIKKYSNIWSKKFGVNISKKMAGFMTISWKNSKGEDIVEIFDLSDKRFSEIYMNDFDEDPNRAITEFYENYRNRGKKFSPGEEELIHEIFGDILLTSDFQVRDFFIGVKLYAPQIKIADRGITYEEVAEMLKESVEKLEVRKQGSEKYFQYGHILFHAPETEGGEGSLSIIYDWDGDKLKEYDIV